MQAHSHHNQTPSAEPATPGFKPRFNAATIICNPASGRALLSQPFAPTPEEAVLRVKQYLSDYGITSRVALTRSAAEATLRARRCAREKCDLVVAMGGDGTVNAVVNGLAGSSVILGVIPIGSVNLLGRELQLPRNLMHACRMIAQGHTTRVDLGKINQHYFVSLATVGFDAFIVKNTHPLWKRWLGIAAYGFSALAGFFRYSFRHIQIRIDGQPFPHRGFSVIIGNGKYYAGDMVLLPEVNMQDGFLDVFIFKKKSFAAFFISLWTSRGGRWRKRVDVEHVRCQCLSISGYKHPVQVDGEFFGQTPVTIRIEPAALRVIVPPKPKSS